MAPKYALYIDYKATTVQPFSFRDMKAKDLYEAIEEAEKYFDEGIYLLKICEKYSKTVRNVGAKTTDYSAILCKRSVSGWHINNSEYSENNVMLRRWEYTGGNPFVDYEIL